MLAPVRCPLELVDVLRRKRHHPRSEAFDLSTAHSEPKPVGGSGLSNCGARMASSSRCCDGCGHRRRDVAGGALCVSPPFVGGPGRRRLTCACCAVKFSRTRCSSSAHLWAGTPASWTCPECARPVNHHRGQGPRAPGGLVLGLGKERGRDRCAVPPSCVVASYPADRRRPR